MEAGEERDLKGAEKIEEVFQNGFSLDSKVLHYIDSTFSNPSATEIEKILTGESDFEKETLLKLIFSPDESMQFLLEEFLEAGGFHERRCGEDYRIFIRAGNSKLKSYFRMKEEL